MGLASPGDVCPAPPSSGVVSARVDDEVVDYVGFGADSGSVSKMAIVRRRVPQVLGRYVLGDAIAAGGMATVHLGRLVGQAGFSRTVAVKRLHGHLATNPEFVQRFVDEARIASRVRHTNVVQTLDVVSIDGELLLVLDYVHGESLARLRRLALAAGGGIPPAVASGILGGVLRGLHAAHEAKSNRGLSLDLVHRDVSPQNILVGADGVARVLDFGIAKATGHSQETLTRDVKGKLAYMPPEQVSGEKVDRRADLFAAGVVLWEALAGERLFRGDDVLSTIDAIYNREVPRLADRGLGVRPEVDDVLARALAKDANGRFETADAMAIAVEAALPAASDREISEWVGEIARDVLAERLAHVATFESDDSGGSKARLYAASAPPPGSAAKRRDALIPPPLTKPEDVQAYERQHESVTSEADTARCSPRFSVSAYDDSRRPQALLTPLVLIAPAPPLVSASPSPLAPVSRRAQVRTPIPMPLAPAKPRRGPSFIQLALLVVAPPLLVMAAVISVAPLRAAANGARPASAPVMVEASEATPVTAPPPAAPPLAAPPTVALVENASADANPKVDVNAGGHARKAVRPPPHKPRPAARPTAVAVNRSP